MPYSHPSEAFTGRLLRSLGNSLRLLHRSNSDFFILGSTGNVYTVTLSAAPTCSCPDSAVPCKHILFVYIRVLSLPLDDPAIQRKTLCPVKLTRLLSSPTACDSLAEEVIRRRFYEVLARRKGEKVVAVEDGSTCPVCLEDMGGGGGGGRVVACATCKNPIHEECWMTWTRKGSRTCVICRATWRGMDDEDSYINLSAHVAYDVDDVEDDVDDEEDDDVDDEDDDVDDDEDGDVDDDDDVM